MRRKTIARNISWLAFNGRVLQEAADPTVPLREKDPVPGHFSNNMDEFFQVRVATLRRMAEFSRPKSKAHMHIRQSPERNPWQIQGIVPGKDTFDAIWDGIRNEWRSGKDLPGDRDGASTEAAAIRLKLYRGSGPIRSRC